MVLTNNVEQNKPKEFRLKIPFILSSGLEELICGVGNRIVVAFAVGPVTEKGCKGRLWSAGNNFLIWMIVTQCVWFVKII